MAQKKRVKKNQDIRIELKSFDDSLSYMYGSEIGTVLRDLPIKVNYDAFVMGLDASLYLRDSLLDMAEKEMLMVRLEAVIRNENKTVDKDLLEKELTANELFFEENAKKEGVIQTISGLQYKIIHEGKGASPGLNDTVSIHYRGKLRDGRTFDSSYERGEPMRICITNLIKGWREALTFMKEGAKAIIYIPPELAYGMKAVGPIPAGSMLIFETELIQIIPGLEE